MGEPKPLTAYQQTYHWRNKNCGPWARDWVKKSLPGLRVEQGAAYAEVEEVTSVSGDCDLGQRKGKLLTIYDLEVEMSWKGKGEDGEEVKGTVKVPEVSHEAIDGLSEYVYEFSLTSPESPASTALLAMVRKQFPPILSEKFNTLRPALLEVHGQPSAESPSASGASTPLAASGSSYAPAPPAKAPVGETEKESGKASGVGKTGTVEVKAELQASAADLWGLLTEEGKIPMWSRSDAKMSLTPDSPFSIFGGNVTGKIISAEAPTELVQSWQPKMPNWPSDHYGTMTLTLVQGSSSTMATFTLGGVPQGQESDTQKALDAFYIRGLKQMGLVASHSSRSFPTPPSSSPRRSKKPKRKTASPTSYFPSIDLLGYGAILGLSAVLVGLVWSSFR